MRPTFSRYRYFAKIEDGKPGSQIDAALNNAAFSWHFVGFSCIAPKAPKMGVDFPLFDEPLIAHIDIYRSYRPPGGPGRAPKNTRPQLTNFLL